MRDHIYAPLLEQHAVYPFIDDAGLLNKKGDTFARALADKAGQCEYLRVSKLEDRVDIQQIGRAAIYSMRTPSPEAPNMPVLTSAHGAMVFAALIAAGEVIDGFKIWTKHRGITMPSAFNEHCLAAWDGIASANDIRKSMLQMGVRSVICSMPIRSEHQPAALGSGNQETPTTATLGA